MDIGLLGMLLAVCTVQAYFVSLLRKALDIRQQIRPSFYFSYFHRISTQLPSRLEIQLN